jgi:hypothetical protein
MGVNRMLTTSKRGTGRTYDPIKVALSFAFAVLGLGIIWVGLFS